MAIARWVGLEIDRHAPQPRYALLFIVSYAIPTVVAILAPDLWIMPTSALLSCILPSHAA
jgi:hypothetical protein